MHLLLELYRYVRGDPMQVEAIRHEALQILNRLSDVKLTEALNYLKLLSLIPPGKLDATEEYLENLGWTMLALEAAETEWE